MWFNRPTTDGNYSGEQKVGFESPVPFSKCLRAKIYCNMNVHFDPQGCQTLLLKESEPFLLSLGSWTIPDIIQDISWEKGQHKTRHHQSHHKQPKNQNKRAALGRPVMKLPRPSSNFIAGRPKAVLLFWFLGGFRCAVWLCFVFLVRCIK